MANNAKHPQVSLLLTRPAAGNVAFWDALCDAGLVRVAPVVSPLVEITGLDRIAPNVGEVILTSANALPFAGPPNGRRAYCIGTATTAKAQSIGWNAVQMGQNADELIAALLAMNPNGTLTHLSGKNTRGQVADRLTAAGLKTSHIALYDQRLLPLTQDAKDHMLREIPLVVPLFSPRTAAQFASQATGISGAPLHIIALSAAVAEKVSHMGPASVHICAAPEMTDMVETVKKVARQLTVG